MNAIQFYDAKYKSQQRRSQAPFREFIKAIQAQVGKTYTLVHERTNYIGAGAKIIGGITIGDNSVIGAGSIVTKDIPANVVAVGNPCRVLREINDHDKEFYYKDRKIEL